MPMVGCGIQWRPIIVLRLGCRHQERAMTFPMYAKVCQSIGRKRKSRR